jgi:hypothetical protein
MSDAGDVGEVFGDGGPPFDPTTPIHLHNAFVVGGDGDDGELLVVSDDNSRIALLAGAGVTEVTGPYLRGLPGRVELFAAGQNTVALDGPSATVSVGGDASKGLLVVAGPNGDVVCAANPSDLAAFADKSSRTVSMPGRIELWADNANTVAFDAPSATVRAGGGGGNGVYVARDSDGNATVRLDGGAADIAVGGSSRRGTSVLSNEEDRVTAWIDAGSPDPPPPYADPEMTVGHGGQILLSGHDGSHNLRFDGGTANLFVGGSTVAGDIYLGNSAGKATIHIDGGAGDVALFNADCAEEFDVEDDAEPGSVMVLADDGLARACDRPYDQRVVGVVAGAGGYRPGIVLDRRSSGRPRRPIALVGKAYCLVDAGEGPIRAGDLLTTSQRAGHAMRAADRARAFGAVLGKALRGLDGGTALIPVLVTLQ